MLLSAYYAFSVACSEKVQSRCKNVLRSGYHNKKSLLTEAVTLNSWFYCQFNVKRTKIS